MVSAALDSLLHHPGIWRFTERQVNPAETQPTGYDLLDKHLPGGGWPVGALSEITTDGQGLGELQILLPALARLSRQGRWVAWVAPPYIPYAPALSSHGIKLSRLLVIRSGLVNQDLWAAEQMLGSPSCGAVLLWPDGLSERGQRRLQLAAEDGGSMAVLFHAEDMAARASCAALRLSVAVSHKTLRVKVRKCRGRLPVNAIRLARQ